MVNETVVGLDVHADSITAAILPPQSDIPEVVKLSGDLMQVRRLFRRLSAQGPLRSCYEASGAGFVLHRLLAYDGFPCEVIAPSLIPRKPWSITSALSIRSRAPRLTRPWVPWARRLSGAQQTPGAV